VVYVGIVGHMVQWFPDKRRGFATGMVAAGYGMGAVLTTFPISNSIAAVGYQRDPAAFWLAVRRPGLAELLRACAVPPADWMSQDIDPWHSRSVSGASAHR
jgi:OFA family oxalate/formate antiporter-like MFS transporter